MKTAFEKNELPQFDELITIFKEYSLEFSHSTTEIIVMFDGLDECERQYFRQIIHLIQELNDSGIRVYATFREHYEALIYHQLQTQPLQIEADIEDVQNYLSQELEQRDVPDSGFREVIVNEIANGVHGM